MPRPDRVIDQARRDIDRALAAAAPVITCRGRGCFWCCYQPVGLHPAEADLLRRRVDLEPARARLGGKACPFLVDGACSIYAERPLACRMHAVATPPEDCEGGVVGRIASPRRVYEAALRELGAGKVTTLVAFLATSG